MIESKPKYISNSNLRNLSEAQLFEMLFHESSESDIKRRQATFEISRRQQQWTQKMSILFAALSALAAIASAISAFNN